MDKKDESEIQNIIKGQFSGSLNKEPEGLRDKIKDWAVNEFNRWIGKGASSSEIISALKEHLENYAEKIDQVTGTKLAVYTRAVLGTIEQDFKGVKAGLQEVFDIKGAETSGLIQSVKNLADLFSESAAKDFGEAMGFNKAAAAAGTMREKVRPLIGDLLDIKEKAGAIFAQKVSPFGSIGQELDIAGASLETFQSDFAKRTTGLQLTLGIDRDAAMRELETVYSGLDNSARQLAGIKIKTGIEGREKVVEGAEAIVVAAKALGTETATITENLNILTGTLGVNSQDALDRIMTIGKAASATGINVNKFSSLVMESANAFHSFGDMTEESAAMLERFTKNASPARMGAVVEAFKSVSGGIAGMSDEMKAFVSMGTELSGGGGAIESIVRLDAALQSGDKDALQGIFDETISRIEELTGAPVMTMQEAVDTGQEALFYQQAALAKQFGIAGNRAQASDIFAARQTGVVDIESIRARAEPDVIAKAQEKTAAVMDPLQITQNMLSASETVSKFNLLWKESGDSLITKTDEVKKKMLDLGAEISSATDILKALRELKPTVDEKEMLKGTDKTGTSAAEIEQRTRAESLTSATLAENKATAAAVSTVVPAEEKAKAETAARTTAADDATKNAAGATVPSLTPTALPPPAPPPPPPESKAASTTGASAGGATAAADAESSRSAPREIKLIIETKGDLKNMINVSAEGAAVSVARSTAAVP